MLKIQFAVIYLCILSLIKTDLFGKSGVLDIYLGKIIFCFLSEFKIFKLVLSIAKILQFRQNLKSQAVPKLKLYLSQAESGITSLGFLLWSMWTRRRKSLTAMFTESHTHQIRKAFKVN